MWSKTESDNCIWSSILSFLVMLSCSSFYNQLESFDGIFSLSHRIVNLAQAALNLEEESSKVALVINTYKTKVLNMTNYRTLPICLKGSILIVCFFVDSGTKLDVTLRISSAKSALVV